MKLPLTLLAALVVAAPVSLAHVPPGPQTWCDPAAYTHDYVVGYAPPSDGCILGYDGDPEWGAGSAVLFFTTGDGATSGVDACYGWPSTGHHSSAVYAQDLLGFGPQFVVISDWSRPGLEGTPDCGDGYFEPCDPTPPPPSTLGFPLNVVIDTAEAALYATFGPGGIGCNPLDAVERFSSGPGPSGGYVPFAPGADGAYHVLIENDFPAGRFPTGGHVWS